MDDLAGRFERADLGFGELQHYLIVAPNTTDELGQSVFDAALHIPPSMPLQKNWLVEAGGGTLRPANPDDPGGGWISVFTGDPISLDTFAPIARDAARLFCQLAKPTGNVLTPLVSLPGLDLNARNIEGGMFFGPENRDCYFVSRWMLLLHELGWLCEPGSTLRATRVVWADEEEMPFRDFTDLEARLRGFCGGAFLSSRLREEVLIPPSRYYSLLDIDPFSASVAAIDSLTDLVRLQIDRANDEARSDNPDNADRRKPCVPDEPAPGVVSESAQESPADHLAAADSPHSAIGTLLLAEMGESPTTAATLCKKADVIHNSHAKAILARMVEARRCEVKLGPKGGYFIRSGERVRTGQD